ncbi:YoaK family protein [Pseudoalteromonas fenneropenaei]|uniref:YoaK family protein n=1 Tax=Pseudoalteromonas fenneropenaei TaxID=1737459 RepID=A0ABV7CJU6_9GAMM
MLNRLPRWIEAGAFVLAAIAGLVNAVGLLGVAHQAVSHLSGTATLFAIAATELQSKPQLVFHLLIILLSFVLGAAISGVLLHGQTLKLGRHYDTLLWVEALLLAAAAWLLTADLQAGLYCASMACGMQNALVTNYSGAIIRTTHLTGIFTDLGLMLGAWCRGERLDKRKVGLFLLIICGFIGGGSVGALLWPLLSFQVLYLAAIACGVLALIYLRLRHQSA